MAEESSSGFLRLFIAIAVPEAVREEIGRAQGRLKRNSPPGAVRWAQPDQFHITMKFLGDVPAEEIDRLSSSLKPVCDNSPALRLSAHGIGFFPNARKPRVIWVGANDSNGQLSELHQRIDEALRWFEPKERPEKFTGHITLGRFKPGYHAAIPKIVEEAEHFRDRNFGEWEAGAVEIVRSKLTSTRAEHEAISTLQLKFT